MTKSTIFMAIEDKQVLNKVKMLLEKEGYATEGTDDGLKALILIRQMQPSLVILEDSLFRMDGFKVCRFLKFDDQYRHIPIILLISEQRKTDEPLAAEVGADLCLIEPFNSDTLVHEVKRLAIVPKSPEEPDLI